MKLIEVEHLQISKRWRIEPGAVVKFAGGGPQFIGDDVEPHRLTLPGRFRVRAIYRAGRVRHRYFIEAVGLDRVSGVYTVLVSGPAYRSPAGLMIRPYRIKKPRSRQRVAAGPAAK